MDGQGVGSKSSASYVEHSGQMFPSDLVDVRNHKKQSLGRSICCGERTIKKGSMHGTSGTGFVIHLVYSHYLAESIDTRLRSPGINQLSNRAGWGDRIDDSVI